MDPGRKRTEHRPLEFIATGEVVQTETGVLWTVVDHAVDGEYVTLWVERRHGERIIKGSTTGHKDATMLVRNNLTANS